MNTGQAVVFGLIQGLTEFLPVSSSGHLVLMKNIWGLEYVSILFDILLHLATLLAVVIVFRDRLWKITRSIFAVLGRKAGEDDRVHVRLFGVLVLATIVTAVLGIAIDTLLGPVGNSKLVSALFIVTAVILLSTARLKPGVKGYKDIAVKESLFLGFVQGLGVLPGISRSGITISAGIFAGLQREEAGELSFLLSIPAILGATVLKLTDLGSLGESIAAPTLALGMLCSFVSGFVALHILLRLVRKGKLFYFAFYLIPLGIVGLVLY